MSRSYAPLSTGDDEDDHTSRRRSASFTAAVARRKKLVFLGAGVLFLIGAAVVFRTDSLPTSWSKPFQGAASHEEPVELEYRRLDHVKGPPTDSFRDNLLDDRGYITSWVSAGWTNDVMAMGNLIYLAQLTNRTAVLPPFAPSHIGEDAGFIDFADVFDLPSLSRATNVPLIEWKDLKKWKDLYADADELVWDDIGCWSVHLASSDIPKPTLVAKYMQIDPSYTPVSKHIKIYHETPGELHVYLGGLIPLAYPSGDRSGSLLPEEQITPSAIREHRMQPDLRMVCYDFLYFVGLATAFEWSESFSPEWRFFGVHMRWAPSLLRLARPYLRRALLGPSDMDGEDDSIPVPPYIALHVRRADFGGWCDDTPKEECFAPLSAYARRVSEIQATLSQRGVAIDSKHVLMTSDETDPVWWADVQALGWTWIDHKVERTEERLGKWYPVLLDAVFQSMGIGFVGTDRSTMSLLAHLRTVDWHGGVGVDVKWGFKDADAH